MRAVVTGARPALHEQAEMELSTRDLIKGLQVARFSFVFLALLVLTAPLTSALSTPPLSYLPVLLTVAFVAGQVICMRAAPGVGTLWIASSLAVMLFALGVTLLPATTLLSFLAFLGAYGFVIAGFVTLIAPFLAFTLFLVYLKSIAEARDEEAIAGHFLKLSFVPAATIIVAVVGPISMQGELALLAPLSALVIGLMMIVSYSGAIAKLVKSLD